MSIMGVGLLLCSVAVNPARADLFGAIKKAAGDVAKTVEKAAQDTGKTVEKAAQDTGKTVEKAAQDTGKTVEKAAQDTGKAIEKAGQDTGKTLEKAAHDTGHTLEKAGQDTGKTLEKAAQDTVAETGRGVKNVEEAGTAIFRFAGRQIEGWGDTLADGEKRVREGKVVDALWHLGTDPLRKTEENAAKAAQESSLVNTVGQVAATAYGGPGGAAAYAAWFTYKQTGDADMALRVGIITGATSAALGSAGKMPSNTAAELAKKTIVAGAIGGMAVAASGGSAENVRDGFIRAGGMVLVQDGYKRVTTHELDPKASRGDAYCMASVGESCSPPKEAYLRDEAGNIKYDKGGKPLVDIRKTDPARPHVGNWAAKGQANWNHETGPFMTGVSKVPGMNAMSVFHDQWAVSWDMNAIASGATIAPAVVLTYVGTGAPVYDLIQRTNVRAAPVQAQANAQTSTASSVPASTTAAGDSPDIPATQSSAENAAILSADATASFMCVAPNSPSTTRRIVVEQARRGGRPVCRVIYVSSGVVSVPWRADHQADYCVPKAAEFAAKFAASGWSCFGQ